jgi:DNA-directed RNA polymerase sigma subunit (sigma70/sigma32)
MSIVARGSDIERLMRKTPWTSFLEVASPIYSTATFRPLWAALTERERRILTLRWEGETLESIGEMYGLGKERVRQLEFRAYAKMRRTLFNLRQECPEL